MGGIINSIIALIVSLFISGGSASMAEVTPQEAADDFLQGISSGNDKVAMAYMDNEYVNFLENVKGTDEEMDEMEGALFENFSYEITDSASRNQVAVCKVTVKNCDFSKIMDDYEKSSYKFVTENLYSDEVTDKEKLNKHCLGIYIDEIGKTSREGEVKETEVFLPMEADGYGGWRIMLSEDIMKSMLGDLQLPVEE